MTTQAVLRYDLNPLSHESGNARCTVVGTDSSSVPTNDATQWVYVYFVEPPGCLPLCQYVLGKMSSRMCLHNDLNGFAIFNKNGVPEYEIGAGNSWCRVPVTHDSSSPGILVEGVYTMDLE